MLTLPDFAALKRDKRKLVWFAVLAVLVVVAYFVLTRKGTAPPEALNPNRSVQVAVVALSPVAQPRLYAGTLRARVESDQAFRVGGKIAERKVQLGSRVAAGTVMAALENTDLRLARESAEAEFSAAQAARQQAEQEFSRGTQLIEKGWSTQQILDRQRTALEEAKGRHARAERQRDLARNNEGYGELKAERAGVVTALLAEAGQVVSAGFPVLRIAEEGEREALIAIPEHEVATLAGREGKAVLWGESKPYRALLREVSPAADPATRTYAARYRLPDLPQEAPLGASLTLVLDTPDPRMGIRIPLSALLNDGPKTHVFVVGPGDVLERRPVEIASYEAHTALITSGLAAGETIVTLGVHIVQAGQKVRPLPGVKG